MVPTAAPAGSTIGPWLDYLHGRAGFGSPIARWHVEHQVDFGSSDDQAAHALVVDVDSREAYVAPIALAQRIVRSQSLDQEAPP
jgi:hypothetical protein